MIFPGSYDGCVYFLCAASGKSRWVFQTGDAVKSCPAVDPLTGLVIVGSHDGHVYGLNPKVSEKRFKVCNDLEKKHHIHGVSAGPYKRFKYNNQNFWH